jgi:arsenate reductase
MLTVYCYQNCSTCRNALKWLTGHGIAHQVKPIRETPPTSAELHAALKSKDGDLRKLFNTSSNDYREAGLKDRLPGLTESEAFALMHANGNLVKRPFLIGDGIILTGFNPGEWAAALLS